MFRKTWQKDFLRAGKMYRSKSMVILGMVWFLIALPFAFSEYYILSLIPLTWGYLIMFME